MEEDNRKKLIKETITGRRLSFKKAAAYTLLAGLCGLVFGAASAFAFRYVVDTSGSAASQETSGGASAGTAAGVNEGSEDEVSAGSDAGTDSDNSPGSEAEGAASAYTHTETESGQISETEPAGTTDQSSISESNAGSASDLTDAAGSDDKVPVSGNSDTNETKVQTAVGADGKDNASGPAEEAEIDASTEISNLADARKIAVNRIKPCMVTISASKNEHTWFDEDAESIRNYSGTIVDINDREIYILTVNDDFDGKLLEVTFANGSSSSAYVRNVCETDDLCIIAVSAEKGISPETLDVISAVESADIAEVFEGKMVTVSGSPIGFPGSFSFGSIGYINNAEIVPDRLIEAYYSEAAASCELGSFLFDNQGRLLGIAAENNYSGSTAYHISRFVSISSVEDIIDSMLEDRPIAFIGINGVNVGFDMRSNNVPQGVYVSSLSPGCPAYTAGIKRGDVITGLNDNKIISMNDYEKILGSLKPGDEVKASVKRGSTAGEYRDIEFTMTVVER